MMIDDIQVHHVETLALFGTDYLDTGLVIEHSISSIVIRARDALPQPKRKAKAFLYVYLTVAGSISLCPSCFRN